MITQTTWFVIVEVLFCIALAGCGDGGENNSSQLKATDYSRAEHWLALPDSEKAVDVFYLYPTAWEKVDETDPNINEIDNESMQIGSQIALERQASAFSTVGNIFAPYYRQVDGHHILNIPTLAEREALIAGSPSLDAMAAFDYYINHYNDGRPFILAGHSQGSNVLLNLLADYMSDHPQVYHRMIAAYVIGYSVTEKYLEDNRHLAFATGDEDTNVIISYNTQAANLDEGANPVVLAGAMAINPINWSRDETLATTAQGLGSYLPIAGNMTTVVQYADAQVDREKGVIITTAADSGLLMDFGSGIFHRYDYAFYYYNLRANAAQRVAAFMAAEELRE